MVRITSTQGPEAWKRFSLSTSMGVWLTTLRSCLWPHTSVSRGAMLRSPTTTAWRPASAAAAVSDGQAVTSSRKASLWANLGFSSASGTSPPAGT